MPLNNNWTLREKIIFGIVLLGHPTCGKLTLYTNPYRFGNASQEQIIDHTRHDIGGRTLREHNYLDQNLVVIWSC